MKTYTLIPLLLFFLACNTTKPTTSSAQPKNISKDAVLDQIECENAFTPNNDGQNDSFIPVLKKGEFVEFKVYSRWGNLVYSTLSPSQKWDGKEKGKLCPNGVYTWSLEFINETNERLLVGGQVTLIR
ncbi:MAG: gliding motility-associated C-terminal domain-containing protein [Flavobacteriales bacterium]|jgi:gliding motility-associated-like protein|nr:gliding motility-associated C-terminal domain-containing protein [Flavobacteriales bacterium]